MQKSAGLLTFLILVVSSAFLLSLLAAPKMEQDSSFAGAKQCKKCHIDRHKSWSKDLHSKAFDNISGKYQQDPVCLECHTTGFGEGGFTSIEDTPNLTAVQCEQCHGSGEMHIPIMSKLKKDKVDKDKYPEDKKINKRPTICIKCHSPHQEHVPYDK